MRLPGFYFVFVLALLGSSLAPLAARHADHAPASVRYLAPDGDDHASCETPEARCRTLARGLAGAPAGVELRLAAGIYPGRATITTSATLIGGFALPAYAPGGGETILDAQGNSSVLTIEGPAVVALHALEVTGGVARSGGRMPADSRLPERQIGRGGGITAQEADLTLDQVTVRENIGAAGGTGEGGGIFIREGSLTLISSRVLSNTAVVARAEPWQSFMPSGVTTFQARLLPQIGRGGGIYAEHSQVTLRASSIAGNQAVTDGLPWIESVRASGGGLFLDNSTLTMESAELRDNAAIRLPPADTARIGKLIASGGGAAISDSRGQIRSCHVARNQALRGGGLAIGGDSRVAVEGTAFVDNQATDASHAGAGVLLATTWPTPTVALTLTNVLLARQSGTALTVAPNSPSAALVRFATLVSNTVGMEASAGGAITATNSLIVGSDIAARANGGMVALSYTSRAANRLDGDGPIQIGPMGDLRLAPSFIPGDDQYHLAPGAAVIDQGTGDYSVSSDFEGDPRALVGDGAGRARPDLGWDELLASFPALNISPALVARPGQLVTASVILLNRNGVNDTFALGAQGPAGWNARIEPSQAMLAVRQRAQFRLVFQVPATAALNTHGTITITAQGKYGSASGTIEVSVGEP